MRAGAEKAQASPLSLPWDTALLSHGLQVATRSPQEQNLGRREPPLQGRFLASPEGCDKDLPPSFQMRVLPWGTQAARHRLCWSWGAAAPAQLAAVLPMLHMHVHIRLRMSS